MPTTLLEKINQGLTIVATMASPLVALPSAMLDGGIDDNKFIIVKEFTLPEELITNKVLEAMRGNDAELFEAYLCKCSDGTIQWMEAYLKGKLMQHGMGTTANAVDIGKKLIMLRGSVDVAEVIIGEVITECINGVKAYNDIQAESKNVKVEGVVVSYTEAIYANIGETVIIEKLAI